MNPNPTGTATSEPTYTPGYARCKMLMIAYGVALMLLGFSQIWTPLRLVLFGQSAHAEVIHVIKSKPGLPDTILKNDSEVRIQATPRDRSYLYWNEFRFLTTTGQVIVVRPGVASLLKPLYPMNDGDGLPTTDLIYYDPSNPQRVVFPFIVSTWFGPGILIGCGLLAVLIGSVLLYWANRPITLPHLPTSNSSPH